MKFEGPPPSLLSRRAALGLAAGAVAGSALGTPSRVWADDRSGLRIMSARSEVLESRMLQAAGRDMHMLASTPSPPDGVTPMVLVHGLALSGQYMVPVAEALAPGRRVYIPDLPGFGDSHKPDRVLDVPRLADALALWMDAMAIERADLLGNSFGCQIIVDLAARYPDRVGRAILQGPTTPPEERTWFWQFVRWRQNAPNNPPLMGEVADIDYEKCGIVRALTTFEFSLRDPLEDKLDAIAAPTLVVRGAEDPICNQAWAEQVARGLPDGRLEVLPEIAHTLVFTSPQELSAATETFLSMVG